MQVRDIMSTPVVTCRSTDTLNTAAQIMWERDCGVIPVVDDSGAVVGMITDRDISMAAYTQGGPLTGIPVSNAMAKHVFSCKPDDSLDAAERLMSDKQIRRVPIVDGENKPIGILSLNDIARRAGKAGKRDGLDRELAQTMAAICQPRAAVQQQAAAP